MSHKEDGTEDWKTREAELRAELRIMEERQEQVKKVFFFSPSLSPSSTIRRYDDTTTETRGDFRASHATSNCGS